MNKARIAFWAAGVGICISVTSIFAEDAFPEQGPNRILKLLDEKETAYIQDPSKTTDLTAEDIEHTKRVQRLHELETAKDVETEPAGAELVSHPIRTAPAVTSSSDVAIEDLEMHQQESTSIMMRDMARLRAEVMRLNARVQALEMELEGAGDTTGYEAERRFYIPVR